MTLDRDDITIGVPPGWPHTADLEHGVVLAARAPSARGSGFVPTVVLDAEPVDLPFEAWQRRASAHLAALVDGFEEEDSDDYQLGDETVHYRRVSFRSGAHEVVSEQWCWLIQGIGFTLSGTVGREDYADYSDLFEDLAATFSVRG